MKAVSKNINYMDLLKQMDCDILTFDIEMDSGFIESIINDGYTEVCHLRTTEFVSKYNITREHPIGSCAPTSTCCTGKIWVEGKGYYSITLVRDMENTLSVEIDRSPIEQVLRFIEDGDRQSAHQSSRLTALFEQAKGGTM